MKPLSGSALALLQRMTGKGGVVASSSVASDLSSAAGSGEMEHSDSRSSIASTAHAVPPSLAQPSLAHKYVLLLRDSPLIYEGCEMLMEPLLSVHLSVSVPGSCVGCFFRICSSLWSQSSSALSYLICLCFVTALGISMESTLWMMLSHVCKYCNHSFDHESR